MILHDKEKVFLSKLCILNSFPPTRNLVAAFHFFPKCPRDLFFFFFFKYADRFMSRSFIIRNIAVTGAQQKEEEGEMMVLDLLKSEGFWQMQDISKHVLFTNSEFNCLRCYFSLSGYSFILLVYTLNFHLLHIKYFTVFLSRQICFHSPLLPLKQ